MDVYHIIPVIIFGKEIKILPNVLILNRHNLKPRNTLRNKFAWRDLLFIIFPIQWWYLHMALIQKFFPNNHTYTISSIWHITQQLQPLAKHNKTYITAIWTQKEHTYHDKICKQLKWYQVYSQNVTAWVSGLIWNCGVDESLSCHNSSVSARFCHGNFKMCFRTVV